MGLMDSMVDMIGLAVMIPLVQKLGLLSGDGSGTKDGGLTNIYTTTYQTNVYEAPQPGESLLDAIVKGAGAPAFAWDKPEFAGQFPEQKGKYTWPFDWRTRRI